ncbi:MAG: hypothetical protein V1659_04985 [Candidatus Woesearchaeota archaeon]
MNNDEPENNNAELQWSILPATEKDNYTEFHNTAFEEDMRHAEKNILDFPRWSIISGYYSMHNLTKFFLAQEFNIKISSPEIHSKTIFALEYFIRDEKLKIRLIELLKEAKNIYYSAERLKEKTLPVLLKRGKQERGKAQYYSEDYSKQEKTSPRKASYFLENIVKPYVHILTELKK